MDRFTMPAAIKRLKNHLLFQYRLKFQRRHNNLYTQFFRFPNQYRVLVEQVLPRRLAVEPGLGGRPLDVAAFACCTGEEPYTLSYLLAKHFPDLPVRIRAVDLVDEAVRTAREGRYTKDQVYAGPFVTEEVVAGMFDHDGDMYRVKPALASRVSFDVGNMTDSAFMRTFDKCDFVFAQNVLFHLPREIAPVAFQNLNDLLLPGGTLFINGMDTDMRIDLTKRYGLEPVTHLLQEIHEDARVDRGAGWANTYWGREPFSNKAKDWERKFGTIFTRGSA